VRLFRHEVKMQIKLTDITPGTDISRMLLFVLFALEQITGVFEVHLFG
jgi:hypothetical protein